MQMFKRQESRFGEKAGQKKRFPRGGSPKSTSIVLRGKKRQEARRRSNQLPLGTRKKGVEWGRGGGVDL